MFASAWSRGFWIVLGVLVCLVLASLGKPWGPWDQALFDANLTWRRARLPAVSSRIACLGFTTEDYTRWSSTRKEYQGIARAVADVRDQGAAVIVIDLLLIRGEDTDFEPLWQELWKRPDVILARSFENTSRMPGPVPISDEGLALIQRDRDGLIRRYALASQRPESRDWLPSLALATFLKLQGQPWQTEMVDSSHRLKLARPGPDGEWKTEWVPNELHFQPRSAWDEVSDRNFQHLTVTDLARWKKAGEKNRLEGKAVFLANVAPGGGDIGSTVLDPATPKVAIHGFALNSLLQDSYFRPVPGSFRMLGALLFFLVGGLFSRLIGAFRPRVLLLSLGLMSFFWALIVSQVWLKVSLLLPLVTWWACGLIGVIGVYQWQQSLWRWKMTSLRASADMQDPLVLKTLGSYLLVEKLGQGGFGSVYRGIPHLDLNPAKSVAVKIADPEASKNEEFRRRFLRESRISRSLRHPSIVRVLESGEQDGLLYYTMEWLRGGTLRDWLDLRKANGMEFTARESEARPILLGLLEAMAYAHRHSVLHRDLKPENVVLEGPLPKIVDFGLAYDDHSSQLTSAYDIVGTLQYLAPERLQGSSYDARSDQYALGVMGYEMLAGRSPFPETQNSGDALVWRLSQDPTPLGNQSPLCEAVDKMMARNPDDRFARLEEAIEFLTRKAPS